MAPDISGRVLRPALTWVARLSGLALVLLVTLFVVGEGILGDGLPNPLRLPPPVAIELILMLVMTLGLIVAWHWKVAGALATLIAWVGFNLVELVVNGSPAGGAFPLFAIPPVLYLLDAYVRRHRQPGPQLA